MLKDLENVAVLKKNYLLIILYQGLAIIFPLVLTPYLARTIGSTGIGEYSYYLAYASYFALFSMLGIPEHGNRSIAQASNDIVQKSKVFYEIYFIQVCLTVVCSFAYVLFAFFFGGANFKLVMIFSIYVFAYCFDVTWFFYGSELFKVVIVRNFIIKLITLIAVIVFVNNKEDTIKYVIISSVSLLISNVAMMIQIKGKVLRLGEIRRQEVSLDYLRHFRAILVLFVAILAVSIYKIIDKIMLGFISGADELGYYESSERLVKLPLVFVTALATVMMPRISNMIRNGEKTQANKYLDKSLVFSTSITSLICLGISGVANCFVPIFYGAGFEKCVGIIEVLMPSCIFLAFANVVRTQVIIPNAMDKEIAISVLIGAFINVIINILLIPRYGGYGAAVGTLITEIVVCIMQCLFVNHMVTIRQHIVHCIPFVMIALAMNILVSNITINADNMQNLFIKVIIGGAFYFICIGILVLYLKKRSKNSWI